MNKFKPKIMTIIGTMVFSLSGCASTGSKPMAGYQFNVPMAVTKVESENGPQKATKNDILATIYYGPVSGVAFSQSSQQVIEKMEFAIGFDPTFRLDVSSGDKLYEVLISTLPGRHFCSNKTVGIYAKGNWFACFFDKDSDGMFEEFGLPVGFRAETGLAYGGRLGVTHLLDEPIAYENSELDSNFVGNLFLQYKPKELIVRFDAGGNVAANQYSSAREKIKDDTIGSTISVGEFDIRIEDSSKNTIEYEIIGVPQIGEVKLFSYDIFSASRG